MTALRLCFLLFALVVLSCGGGQKVHSSGGIVFYLSETSYATPYSKLVLRISGKEFEPKVYVKDGPLYPGQRVVFEVEVPSGKERLIEAILYDGNMNPVYYAYTVSDLSPDSYILLSLKPTAGSVEVLETFSDQSVRAEGEEVFVLSEDLFSLNWKLKAYEEGFLPGAYLAVLTHRGVIYAPVGQKLPLERQYTINVENPIAGLELFGSYEGVLEGSLRTTSSRITSDKKVALLGIGEGIYHAIGKPLDQSVLLEGPACTSNPSPDCKSIDVRVEGFGLEPKEVLANYRGIEFPVGEPGSFLFLEELEYYLRLERSIESESCLAYFSRLERIENPIPEEYRTEIQHRSFILDVPFKRLRAYTSSSLSLYECRVNRREFFALLSGQEELFVEVFVDGQWVGVKLNKPQEVREVKLPSLRIKEVKLSLEESYLLFEFSTTEKTSYCNLELFSGEYTATIYKIPPHRTHLKVSKLSKEFFESIPSYRLTCFREDGSYARREGPPHELY